jgi:hypothetical protein
MENETENILLKKFYKSVMEDENCFKACSLIKLKGQLDILMQRLVQPGTKRHFTPHKDTTSKHHLASTGTHISTTSSVSGKQGKINCEHVYTEH